MWRRPSSVIFTLINKYFTYIRLPSTYYYVQLYSINMIIELIGC